MLGPGAIWSKVSVATASGALRRAFMGDVAPGVRGQSSAMWNTLHPKLSHGLSVLSVTSLAGNSFTVIVLATCQ